MTRVLLPGLDGANPLGFLASIGLLRVLHHDDAAAKLGFADDGSCCAFVEGPVNDVIACVVRDAEECAGAQAWRLEYEKTEKKGVKRVADLKPPADKFETFLHGCIERWCNGDVESAAYAAAYGTSIARDGKDNTKPTAFHFTAANQEFLKAVEESRRQVDTEWTTECLMVGHAARPGSNLRWDPSAERNWALMANNPNDEGTSVQAPLEWLAFRGLPLLPTFPRDGGGRPRVITTGVGRRGTNMCFSWPLWSIPASLHTVSSLLPLDWCELDGSAKQRGVFAVCRSEIRRPSQRFGNFGPAVVEA